MPEANDSEAVSPHGEEVGSRGAEAAESSPESAVADEDVAAVSEDPGPKGPADDEEPADTTREARVQAINRAVLGQLVLHYESRDVTVVLDGDAGLRVMAMFANRKEGRWADILDPEQSWALSGWLVLDLHEPLAMSWLPGLPAQPARTAVDPAPAV